MTIEKPSEKPVNHLDEAKQVLVFPDRPPYFTFSVSDALAFAQANALIAIAEQLKELVVAVGKLPQVYQPFGGWEIKTIPAPWVYPPCQTGESGQVTNL